MVQKGQKDPRSLLGNATGRDEPGCREGLSGSSGKEDDAASPRLYVVTTRDGYEGGTDRLAVGLLTQVPNRTRNQAEHLPPEHLALLMHRVNQRTKLSRLPCA
jgi:hypothetical protein